jgi:hypothetical protein
MARNPLRAQQRLSGPADTATHGAALRPVRAVKGGQDARTALIAELELHLSSSTTG